jgi:hypothetical protein
MLLGPLTAPVDARGQEPRAEADALVVEGARLGEESLFEEAILRFKAAESRLPRALHDCNIGLAYARLARLPQAQFFLERCRRRSAEPLPSWVAPRAETTLAQLRAGRHAPVRVETSPGLAPVTVSVFAPDELVDTPADLWLPLDAEVVIEAVRPGLPAAAARVRLVSTAPSRVVVELPAAPLVVAEPAAPASLAPAPVEDPPALAEATSERPIWPWVVAGVGALAAGTGAWSTVSGAGLAEDARATRDPDRYDDLSGRAEFRWGMGWGLLGAGATALTTGLLFGTGVLAP